MDNFQKRYDKLNQEQRLAVDTIDGPVLVVAGPGSGKTELLSLRVANILRQADIYPGSILCLTFTEAAAANMRERLAGLIGRDAYKVAIHTFHSFSSEIIGNYFDYFYNGAVLRPADDLAQLEILSALLDQLPFGNPLKKEFAGEHTYIGALKKAISALKKAGLSADEFTLILKHNQKFLEQTTPLVAETFAGRISAKTIAAAGELLAALKSYGDNDFPAGHFSPLSDSLALSLEIALNGAGDKNTKPLTLWKDENTKKDENGQTILRDFAYLDKMYALADLYGQYEAEKKKLGYYDFDDMLFDAVAAIEQQPALRADLQEKYLYILVDEFQDTNDAQMKLLQILADNPANEDFPNIMAVGDDDQAIYKFQGAELSNILGFKKRYPRAQLVTLAKNYRSGQKILDLAQQIIGQGEKRLENIVVEINKKLEAAGPEGGGGRILRRVFETPAHEARWIAKEVQRHLAAGEKAEEIAVIGRTHSSLSAILPYFCDLGLPISYERRDDVLQEPLIRQIINICRFVVSLSRQEQAEADNFLPEILSYPFWGLDRRTVWKISLEAAKQNKTWLEIMLDQENVSVKKLVDFFLELGLRSQSEPLEQILHLIVGEREDSLAFDEQGEPIEKEGKKDDLMRSPFRAYYFSQQRYEKNKAEYLRFLASLDTFIKALREYRQGKFLRLEDLLRFVDARLEHKLPLSLVDSLSFGQSSVRFLTAHKAKGLEFKTVFVLGCQAPVWQGKGISNILPFPKNLSLLPEPDNNDDYLRIFYVALTRAKSRLYLTSHRMVRGREISDLAWLTEIEWPLEESLADESETESEELTVREGAWQDTWHRPPLVSEEKKLLESFVVNYKMSATHLNNFLDVSLGGPQIFLEQNLLRFPQPKTASGSYGTAMHAAIQKLYLELKRWQHLPSKEEFLSYFNESLAKERMTIMDFEQNLKRGQESLSAYYDLKKDSFSPEHRLEENFSTQQVVVGSARLSGKIDKMILSPQTGELEVYDFKTGKSHKDWKGVVPTDKIKLWRYRQQLLFYKILVENSRQYGRDFKVKRGVLEFLEPDKKSGEFYELSLDLLEDEALRLSKLIEIVYNKIRNLDFPKIEKYSTDLSGIKEFEEDLLNGSI